MTAKVFIGIVLLSLLFSGCKVQKTLYITDGNKKDGTITMKYNYKHMQNPEVQMEESKEKALKKCKSWGYSDVEFYEANTKKCAKYNPYGVCVKWVVTYNAQCVE